MTYMQKFSGRRLIAIVFVFTTLAYSFLTARAQSTTTPTVVNVTSQIQQANVTKLGINLSDQDYWDSGQIMKNLIFINPGFEAQAYRSILNCVAVTANTCVDSNDWSPMPANYWQKASYRVLSGAAAGTTGTILSSTAANYGVGPGLSVTFDKSVNMAVGDYVTVSTTIPGNGQNGWWTYPSGGATITSETTDLSPNTQGKQALSVNASGSGQSATVNSGWDATATKSFLQMNGTYQLTFRAKGTGGNNQLSISIYRIMAGEPAFINKTITLTSAWQDYTVPFTASETGSAVGNLQLNMTVSGASMYLDDVAINQTNTDPTNTSVFRDDVVNTLKALNPGTIRMYGGSTIGVNLIDDIAPVTARYPEGVVTGTATQSQLSYGITEFLQLCALVGADPWITIPTATTPQEMTDFMDYLLGDGSTTYSAIRVAAGQTAPWTSVFNKIHLELGNETWNSSFQGEIMAYPAYPQWANQVFGAARQSPNYEASKFDLVLSGFAAVPGYTQSVLQYSTQHDSVDIGPYLMFSANNDTLPNLFNSLFAEPEMFDSPGGEVYQNFTVAQAAKTSASGTSKPSGLNVYEVNLSTFNGSITQSEATQFETSLGGGIGLADHLLQMMRLGVGVQNVFALTGYQAGASNGNTMDLYGTVVDMGTQNLRRPSFLSEALANTAIQGDMLQTQQTGTNPTWNEPLSSDNVQYNGAHYIQSFAFLSGESHSLVLFNLNQTTALPVTFTGANAPTGTVAVTVLNSANITDNNETSSVVKTTSNSLSSFNPATAYSLPAHSMTVLTWTGAGTASGSSQAATPVISLPTGTYPTTESVTISEASPGATVYYTTDGSTPTASSTAYSGAITVSSAEKLSAIAIGAAYVSSPVVTATYAISATLPAPAITPAGGTYASAQTVTLTPAPGSTVYYTTNGSAPTTSSTKYTSPLTVSSSQTVQAMAAASGYSNSSTVSASYTIVSGHTDVSFGTGFTTSGLTLNGGAKLSGTALQLTDGGTNEARSVWYSSAVPVGGFISDFQFQILNPQANGFTFTIQNSGLGALGGAGGSLGYQGMAKSVALKFDIYNSAGEGTDSTGVYLNGATPTVPSTDLTSTGVKLISGDLMQAHVVYDGTYLTLTLTDTVTKAVAVEKYAVNIPSTVGGSTAYVGFTASTGGMTATQNVLNWTFVDTSGGSPVAAAPSFSVAAGTYSSAQSVSITDSTPGATIYYTTNGSVPTTSSTKYTSALAVGSTETVEAIAVASGYTTSSAASATYTIKAATSGSSPSSPAAAPKFSLAAGSYTGAQSITLSDATAGAAIYYTTNGTTPTTSSTKYAGAISVSTTTTLEAIAVASGYTNSAVTSATYTITTSNPGSTTGGTTRTLINFPKGFTTTGLRFNGGSSVMENYLVLTDGGANEARSTWFATPVPVSAFTTDFAFLSGSAIADGFTFTIQNAGATALGLNGGSLGYAGIGKSVAVKFDLYSNAGEGNDSTGLYTNGAQPTLPSTNLSSTAINFHSGHLIHAHVVYNGKTLALSLTDTVTGGTVTEQYTVNIPSIVGGTTAYVGFTGSTGGETAVQVIQNWTYAID